MLEATLEGLVADLTEVDGGGELDRARSSFHERTGEIAVGDPWYEERIRFFFDDFVCDHRTRDGQRIVERWLEAHPEAPVATRRVARACTRAARSLYEVVIDHDTVHLDDLLGGGRFVLPQGRRLTHGDIFDGRLLVLEGALALAPGIIFHPPQTHGPLRELLVALGAPLEGELVTVLDALLRMRMRMDRFTSIRARHIYRLEALEDRDILSAAWARKTPQASQKVE